VFVLRMPFKPSLMFLDKDMEPTLEWRVCKVLHLGRLWPISQTSGGKACLKQRL
jgi:hypothetical protein